MYLLLFLLIGVAAIAVTSYNALQKLGQDVREKASNIQVSISKKLTLINQLIDVVKNYQESEQLVQLKISQDASAANLTSSYQQSGAVLAAVQGMADKFPNLKANEQYHRLVDSIQHCESNIQDCRENYNRAVKEYNTKRSKIPVVFFAKSMGFPEAPYMQFDLSGMNAVTTLQEFKTDDGERLQQLFSGAGNKIAGIATQAGKAGKELGKDLVEKIRELPKENGTPRDN
jgi:LemA protein